MKTPIQIGENFMGPEQMAQALAAGACDYVMPDAERIGGVTGWMRAAALAQGAGVEMSSHLFPGSELPPAGGNAHLPLARVRGLGRRRCSRSRCELKDGHVIVPGCAGHRPEWDEKAVERYRV